MHAGTSITVLFGLINMDSHIGMPAVVADVHPGQDPYRFDASSSIVAAPYARTMTLAAHKSVRPGLLGVAVDGSKHCSGSVRSSVSSPGSVEWPVPRVPAGPAGCKGSIAWGRLSAAAEGTKGGFMGSKPWLAPEEEAPATGRFRPGRTGHSSLSPLEKMSVSVMAGAESSAKSS